MDIVYRVGGDGYQCALFAERASAERVAQALSALRESKTWGEFRDRLPFGEWERELEYRFEEVPGDDAPFHRDMVPGYADGDYPEWLRRSALEWFPPDLIEKYAVPIEFSVFNGEALEIPANKADKIAAELRAMGHRVERTDRDIS